MGGQVVSYVPDQLPRSRAYAAGPRRRTRPRVGGLLARSVLRYVTECKELIARIVGCSCDPGGRCCGGDLVDAVAGIANDRREPAVAREISRRNPCIRLDPAGPDHEAIIRFGGEAPRQRAHSNERFDDHVPARVTTTSDRNRPVRQEKFRLACRNSECLCSSSAR